MELVKSIFAELLGLFIDDGALALLTLAIIAVVVAGVKLFGLPPLLCGVILIVGYLGILGESVLRYAKRKRL